MSALPYSSKMARWAALPRRTVQLRLTALYGALFLASGAGLLTIANILASIWSRPQPRPQLQLQLQPVLMAPVGSSLGRISAVPQPVPFFMTGVGSGRWRISVVPQPVPSQAGWSARVSAGHAATLSQLLTEWAIALGAIAVVSVALGWLIADRVLRPVKPGAAATATAPVSPAWQASTDPSAGAASAMSMSSWYYCPPDAGNDAGPTAECHGIGKVG